MPKITVNFSQLDSFNRKLAVLIRDAEDVAKFSVFDGARVAADAMSSAIAGLSVVPDVESIHAWRRGTPTLINYTQRRCLQEALGIAKMRVGVGLRVSTSVGFDGYNDIKTDRWPNGQPNIMIAASCEHGSSAMLEQPFITAAYVSSRARIVAVMELSAGKKIQEIILDS